MHHEQTEFVRQTLERLNLPVKGMKVLDVGSLDINGNNRIFFPDCDYLGIDIGEGKNVDLVCRAHEMKEHHEYFDIVISTECFEHDEYWQKSLENITLKLLKPNGHLIFTCATVGRPEHGTRRTSPQDAPFIGDYYRNISFDDIYNLKFTDGSRFTKHFSDIDIKTCESPADLYFYGKKIDHAKLR